MPFSPKSLEEKPYNVCLNCVNIGEHCDGPNFLAMGMERLCEWCRFRKDYLHNLDPKWTNAYIAEQAGIHKITVDRFLSGNMLDAKMSTVASIVKVLVNGSWGQYPCAMAELISKTDFETDAELAKKAAEADRLKGEHEKVTAEMRGRIHFLREQVRAKDKLLDERADFLRIKDRYIKILAFMFLMCLGVFAAALVVDIINPNLGFIWT